MIPVRWYLTAAAVLGLAAGVLWFGNRQYKAGADVGRAQVRALWDEDTKARDSADAAIRAQNAAKEATARERNDAIVTDYAKQLAAATDSRDGYFRLLQRARQVSAKSAPEAGGAPGTAPASPQGEAPEARGVAELIDAATADALTEARQNADQLDQLIAVVKPQM